MNHPEPNIRVKVDVTNPGQFFACCGLLELADRLWPGAEGCFSLDDQMFLMSANGSLAELMESVAGADLTQVRHEDPYSTPFNIGSPFRPILIDWWETDMTGARDLKVWAGTMESYGIAQAMQHALNDPVFHTPDLLDIGMVVTVPQDKKRKKEPFYFDSRRAPNAHSRDIGFSPNSLGITSIAHPAVELLCIIGLQVARPISTSEVRVYDYFTWHTPLLSTLLLASSTGFLRESRFRSYRFENWYRTGQKKHKSFRSAIPLPQGV